MAKPTTPVDQVKLKTAIRLSEKDGPLGNLNELWKLVAEKYNAMSPPQPISFSVVGLRISQWKLETKTKAGRRGRAPGEKLSDEQKAAMQAGRRGGRRSKFDADPNIQESFALIRQTVPERWTTHVQKLTEQGSMKSAVALKCLDCSCFQPVEIKLCATQGCPLWAFRPYQTKDTDQEDIDEKEVA